MRYWVVLWCICGFVNWGFAMGDFMHEFPAYDCVGISAFWAFIGPVGTTIGVFVWHPAHWRLKPMTTEERWEYFHKTSPTLDREYFERNYN